MKTPPLFYGLSVSGLIFLYAPILLLIIFSFNAARFSPIWEGWTLHWYGQLVTDRALWAATQNSLLVGVSSTLIALGFGVGAAFVLERERYTGTRVVDGIVMLPLVIPEIMMGVALLLFFVLTDMPLGLLTITIGHGIFSLPLVIVIVRARLQKLDPQLIEAAHDLGANPWQAFRLVTFPLLWPAIISAALMAFTVSLDDFVITFFITGPGATTLPLYVFSMIRTGISPAIHALSTLLVVTSMILISLSFVLQRK
ncbi:MAG: ABC transporter permease subunit [Nitrospirales bacterium]|nr:ABC transporter permease subunit [Nitrospirales bacterium]